MIEEVREVRKKLWQKANIDNTKLKLLNIFY